MFFLEAAVLESNVILFLDSERNALGKQSDIYCQFQLDEQEKKVYRYAVYL